MIEKSCSWLPESKEQKGRKQREPQKGKGAADKTYSSMACLQWPASSSWALPSNSPSSSHNSIALQEFLNPIESTIKINLHSTASLGQLSIHVPTLRTDITSLLGACPLTAVETWSVLLGGSLSSCYSLPIIMVQAQKTQRVGRCPVTSQDTAK